MLNFTRNEDSGLVLFPILDSLLSPLKPLLIPLCFICAWGFTLALIWTMISAVYATIKRSQTMHKIPCADCQFFTNDHRLKCTINPFIANTEEAISCADYSSK